MEVEIILVTIQFQQFVKKSSSLWYWKRVSSPQPGDIVAAHNSDYTYHVGIYVGNGETVSANNINVARKDWPLGTHWGATGIVFWRYTG